MIKAVIFDIDNTLYPSHEFAELARKNAINAMIRAGLELDEKKIEKELELVIRKKGSNYPNHFDDVLKKFKVRNKAKYVAAAVAAYHDTKITILPYPEVPNVLLRLRDKKIRLYIASEGLEVKQWDKLLRLQIAQYFDDVFVVDQKEGGKNKMFYERVSRKIGIEPSECIMVGDKEDKDIIPAKKAGFKTFRIFRGPYAEKNGGTIADFSGKELTALLKII